MGGQPAEQIIAGVVLSERLAVTMYGAIHRAQFGGQRNLRGLVVDPRMLAEGAFRIPLTDARAIAEVVKLEHPNIVSTMTVETGGPDVVVVTRGGGRYVTVQDLITAAKSRSKQGGKLSTPVAALIGRSVIEALAVAHKAGVIHGAVHPRSVLVDEDGSVRLGDFVVGRALTTAVAQGADSSLWRGLAGYIAPELVVGEDPAPGADVFAVGAMLFTMLSGEAPPGTLRVTPAVERLVQRALDTDPQRRYKSAADLLDNLVEAMEDDRWEIADRGELIKEAGLQTADSNIDDATEDLLASLGSSTVNVTPMRPSMDARAAEMARSQPSTGAKGRLDQLLADLDENTGLTKVDDEPFDRRGRDPISELIRNDPRKKEAIVSSARVPSLDDPDEDATPLPPPARESDLDMSSAGRRRLPSSVIRANSHDEAAALSAIGDLDEGAKRVTTAADQASAAAHKLEQVALRVEAAAKRAETNPPRRSVVEPILIDEAPPPRLKSRMFGIVSLLVVIGAGAFIYYKYDQQEHDAATALQKKDEEQRKADELTKKLTEELPDPGSIAITSNPPEAGVWLKIGRTPAKSIPLSSKMMHELRIEGLDGFQPVDTQVMPPNWSGEKDKRQAAISVVLKPQPKDPKKHVKLPAMPPKPPDATGFVDGRGPIAVDSVPQGAEAWMYVGMTNSMELSGIQAGQQYELRVLKDGYLPAYVTIAADDWREPGGDPNMSINVAKKKPKLERNVDLAVDPSAKGK